MGVYLKLVGQSRGTLATLACAGALLCAGTASAAFIGVSGGGDILIPDATPNTGATANFFNNTPAHGWDELQNFQLTSALLVDAVAPGVYDMVSDLSNIFIPAGTFVSSHLIFWDPLAGTRTIATYTLNSKILGVIARNGTNAGNDRLLASDYLGNPLTVYPTGFFQNRGLEFGADVFTIGPGNTVTIDFGASSPGDQIRIITQGTPEPATLALFGIGSLGLAGAARRRRKNLAA